MKILPLHQEIKDYLKKRNLEKKFKKQEKLFGGIEIDIQKNRNISPAFSSEQEIKKYFSLL